MLNRKYLLWFLANDTDVLTNHYLSAASNIDARKFQLKFQVKAVDGF